MIERAAEAVAAAQALVIGAGAGMSVDAGIPAYRLSVAAEGKEVVPAVPAGGAALFTLNPAAAWGRTGTLLQLFRDTLPHRGYEILLRWARRPNVEAYVVTSNVDGLFLATGFTEDEVLEGHGSLHFLQCTKPCSPKIWSAADYQPVIDEERGWARPPLPTCSHCGEPARPNCFYFGDTRFNPGRAQSQADAFKGWLRTVEGRRVVVVECGAGTAIPTIRNRCEEITAQPGRTLIRINPGEPEAPGGAISIPLPAETALQQIEQTGRID